MSEQQREAEAAQDAAQAQAEMEEVLAALPATGYMLIDEFARVSVFVADGWFGAPKDKVLGPVASLPVGSVYDYAGVACSAKFHEASETIEVEAEGRDDTFVFELSVCAFDAAPHCGG